MANEGLCVFQYAEEWALTYLAWAGHGKEAAQRSPRCEECLKKRRYDPWRLLTEAEQHDAWDRHPMPKRELAEVAVECQKHSIAAFGFCCDIHISDAWSELRDVHDVEAEATKKANAAAREALVGEISFIHLSLRVGGDRRQEIEALVAERRCGVAEDGADTLLG